MKRRLCVWVLSLVGIAALLSLPSTSRGQDAPSGAGISGRTFIGSYSFSGNTGALSATTLFTPPATGMYVIEWDMNTTTIAATSGTISALTFAWHNTNAMSRNTMLIGPQILDLHSLTSTGLLSAEVSGTQLMFCGTTAAVTWATTVGTAIVGSPQYSATFRVYARN